MTADAVEVAVEVPAPEAPEPAPVDDAPDVVVVDTGGDSGGDSLDVGLRLGDHEARISTLEAALGATVIAVEEVASEVDAVEDIADAALEVAVAEPDEPEPVVEDEPPADKPWTHKGMGELFGRKP